MTMILGREVPDGNNDREQLRERFRRVILSAGYQSADRILAEWFDKYTTNVPEFISMLEEYEKQPARYSKNEGTNV